MNLSAVAHTIFGMVRAKGVLAAPFTTTDIYDSVQSLYNDPSITLDLVSRIVNEALAGHKKAAKFYTNNAQGGAAVTNIQPINSNLPAGQRQPADPKWLLDTIIKALDELTNAKHEFSAYGVTKLLRVNNPGVEIIHDTVRQIVHDEMTVNARGYSSEDRQYANGEYAQTYYPLVVVSTPPQQQIQKPAPKLPPTRPAQQTPPPAPSQSAPQVGQTFDWGLDDE